MRLVDFAYTSGISAKAVGRRDQKALGQFMTPPTVARFMAERCLPSEDLDTIRISIHRPAPASLRRRSSNAWLIEVLRPKEIHVVLHEIDKRFLQVLRNLVGRMRRAAASRGVLLTASIRTGDFLLSPIAAAGQPFADVIIANPPYFKLNASDPRAVAHSYAVYGQPEYLRTVHGRLRGPSESERSLVLYYASQLDKRSLLRRRTVSSFSAASRRQHARV